ncbi:MAG: TldD/PmbA family protein [Bacteroidales bacterium]
MDYQKLIGSLVSKALDLGADEAEVYLETGRNLSVQVQDGELESIEEAATVGVGFRVIVDGCVGFSHCNDLSDKSLKDALSRAVAFARLTTPDEHNKLPGRQAYREVEGLYDPEIALVPIDEKIRMAVELERLAMQDSRITKSSGAGWNESEGEVFIANSHGLTGSYRSAGCGLFVSVVAEKGDQKNTGGEGCSRRFFRDLKSLEEIAGKAARDAWSLLDPVMIPTQRAAVIFDPDVAGSLLGGVIAALNGDRVNQGASFLKDSLGQAIASGLLTITDDGTRPKGLGSAPFDGEGVPTQRRVLIEGGILKGFIYNTISGSRAGVESTGNASRGGFSSLPEISTHSVSLEPGSQTPEEITEATAKGLLVKEITGYGIDPVSGNFSGGASGFWIENGQVRHPVKGITIAGSALEILHGIDMLGNDLDLNRGFAAPTLRVREMQIGGM